MNLRRLLDCLFLVAVISSASWGSPLQEGPDPAPKKVEDTPEDKEQNEKVEALFESFRKKEYREFDLPDLSFEDIPALMELGKSEAILECFPRNLFSSQFEATCSEGMVALWLIEGIRTGTPIPSLNALCFKKGNAGEDWTARSESNHEQVLKAYQNWWKTHQAIPDQARNTNPLRGLELHWY